jgi:hypothetical protein
VITLQGATEKNPILLSLYWKSENFRRWAIKKEAKNWYQKGCKED